MAEAAGLAFGIVPILVMSVKSWQVLVTTLQEYHQRHATARLLLTRLKAHQRLFKQTCEKLLRPALSANTTLEVLLDALSSPEDPQTKGLSSAKDLLRKSVVECLRQRLGEEDLSLCIDHLGVMDDLLKEIDVEFSKMREMHRRSQEDKRSKPSHVADVLLKSDRHKTLLEDLKSTIMDLRDLIGDDARSSTSNSSFVVTKERVPVPSWMQAVRTASMELFSVLDSSWTCQNASHQAHEVGLLANADIESSTAVRMNVAITCRQVAVKATSNLKSIKGLVAKDQIRLKVESISIMPAPPRLAKRRKFDSDCQASKDCSADHQNSMVTGTDLQKVQSICCHLARPGAGDCVGYLGPGKGYTHVFFHGTLVFETRDVRLSDALGNISNNQQLKLAYRLAIAVLQFTSTPWLQSDWRLKDLAISKCPAAHASGGYDVEKIHVKRSLTGARVEEAGEKRLTEKSRLQQELGNFLGVRNWTLCNLGIALIEIACKKTIADMRITPGDDDVVTARRMVNRLPKPFGSEYRNIADRCLWNEFVPGKKDLIDPELQTAVYNDVVRPLAEMTTYFEKLDLKAFTS